MYNRLRRCVVARLDDSLVLFFRLAPQFPSIRLSKSSSSIFRTFNLATVASHHATKSWSYNLGCVTICHLVFLNAEVTYLKATTWAEDEQVGALRAG